MLRFMVGLVMLVVLAGCVQIDPKLIEALAKDDASICASSDTRGGAGGIIGGATGGYGSHTMMLCRSGKDTATLTIRPDGSMSVQNGDTATAK